jgi:DNA oxidative demethylase
VGPEGFVLRPDALSPDEELALLSFVRGLDFGEVRMHGVRARRRVAQFGRHYAFESFRLTPAAPMPSELDELRGRAAALADVDPERFEETLVTEYSPGAGIGWHRDAPPFGIVAGVSLGAACRMRFRKGEDASAPAFAVELPPRSIYLLTGSARSQWRHMIPPVKELRYSVTFRTLRSRKPT